MEHLDDFQTLIKLAVEVHRVEDLLAPSLEGVSVPPLQLAALRILYFEGSMTLGGLAKCMGVSLPNGSREVRFLSSHGLVLKEQDRQDRRIVRISLTPAGREQVERTFRSMGSLYQEITRSWSREKREAFTGTMSRILECMGEIR